MQRQRADLQYPERCDPEFITKFPDPARPEVELEPNGAMEPHRMYLLRYRSCIAPGNGEELESPDDLNPG
jgi:hypothetical protein